MTGRLKRTASDNKKGLLNLRKVKQAFFILADSGVHPIFFFLKGVFL